MSAVPSVQDIHDIADMAPTAPGIWTNPLFSYINKAYTSIQKRRSSLGLTNPGTAENVNREVARDVCLTPFFYSGLRADVSKSFSLQPAFQVSHALSLGSPVLPSYAFAVAFANEKTLLQGNIEADMSLSGRMHYNWQPTQVSKAQFQISDGQPAIVQLEHDYLGSDFSLNFKAMNPTFLFGAFSGVVTGSILQSLTPHLAVGLETMYSSAPSPELPANAATSYFGRYSTPNWIASAQLMATGSATLSFWRKIADKVEAGLESTVGVNTQQAMMTGAPPSLEGITAIAAKYEFRQSVFRGQIDSDGKVSCLVERRVLPILSLTFAGEIDHAKSTSRVGFGLQLEAGSEEVFEQQQQLMIETQQREQALAAVPGDSTLSPAASG